MAINALNSGARVWLADQEDATSPLWENVVQGQVNLLDAVRGTLEHVAPGGRRYAVTEDEVPTIVVRPRGWHLTEKHVLVDGAPVSGALVDFALYLAACGRLQIERGQGPYFYLPKLESHLEARLWNDVFVTSQDFLEIPRGSIRATVLIETYPAAFEMEEILYELREHAAGLNAGRWDYVFSVIKTYRTRGREGFVLPDRSSVTMTVPFMRAYTELLVATCHRRGAHAIGGMSAFVPSKDDAANDHAFAQLDADKTREAADGFDGSWVAHPGMVAACREAFDRVLCDRPHQVDRLRPDVEVTAADLLDVASTPGEVTEDGLRTNINVGIHYIASWLRGSGAVGIRGLMEDAATAEISRSQVWQWLNGRVTLADGSVVDEGLVRRLVDEETARVSTALGGADDDRDTCGTARSIFLEAAVDEAYVDFLTLLAYERVP